MIAFQTSVEIDRPTDEVFAYLSDLGNFPHWNSAVQSVRPASGPAYVMERELPTGHATNRLEIVAWDSPHEFALRATEGPTPFLYRYRFVAADKRTVVHLDAQLELTGVAALVTPLARHGIRKGVDDNLATLKLTLEAAA